MRSVKVCALLLVISAFAVQATAGAAKPKTCVAGVLHPVGTGKAAFAAVVKGDTDAFEKPGGRKVASFPKMNDNGYPTTFSIVGAVLDARCHAGWYRVKLPMRPNGSTGYIRPAAVAVERVTTKIEVDVSDRTLVFTVGGKTVLRTSVAVGSSATPTPIGRFYVNQRILTVDRGGPYGPGAIGISAFSNVLTGWAQGGPIAIHGTNQPWSIGKAVSNGCIRVPNATLERLFKLTPGGTPVVIHP